MKFINSSLTYFLAAIFCIILATGCLDSNQSQSQSSIQLGLEVENMDSTLVSNNDSLSIDQVRIIFSDLYFGFSGDSTSQDSLVFNEDAVVVGLDANEANYQNPRGLTGGGVPDGIYSSFTIHIPKAPEGSTTDFVDSDGTRYTMIIDGNYNGSDFTYKSERTVNKTFTFQPVQVTETDPTHTFLITSNVRNWFSGGNGFLDPTNDDNSTQINDNITASFGFEEFNPTSTY